MGSRVRMVDAAYRSGCPLKSVEGVWWDAGAHVRRVAPLLDYDRRVWRRCCRRRRLATTRQVLARSAVIVVAVEVVRVAGVCVKVCLSILLEDEILQAVELDLMICERWWS